MTVIEVVDNDTGVLIEGSIVPRLFTPPLVTGAPGPCGCGCALTPETSYGFDVDRFARDTLLAPLDPWQRWAVIHAGELYPDGRPRFRRVLIVVARQNGKTHLLIVLALFWMFLDGQRMILGTSTQTKYAKEPWEKSHALALAIPELAEELPPGRMHGMRKVAGELEWKTADGARYLATTSNEEAGRSLSLDRVIADELARQFDHGAYAAVYYAMRARYNAQWFGLSTPLDARSVVFNDLRDLAINHVKNGGGDERLGLFEWSAADGADPLDPRALAQANPNTVAVFDHGAPHRPTMADLLNEARSAVKSAGEALVKFKTESMCIAVKHASPAIDAVAWAALPEAPAGFEDLRGKVALVVDVSKSSPHTTLYAAAMQLDGRVRIGVVKAWEDTAAARRELPAHVARVGRCSFGWLPGGPAAALAAELADRTKIDGRRGAWPPPGVTVVEIRGELPAVCMGFNDLVAAGQVARIPDELLDENVEAAERLPRGDAWTFSRKGKGDCDALYAAAGAVHLARTLPAAPAPLRAVTEDDV